MGDIIDPTIRPHVPFDALEDAKVLRKAMKGLGTDEDIIMQILTKRTATQRLAISTAFKNEFERDLIEDLNSELGGKFEDVILALMEEPSEYLAKILNAAMAKIGTDEDVLTEILCTRGNEEIHKISQAYENLYGNSLESDISGDISGDYRRLLVLLLTIPRSTEPPTSIDASSIAQTLYNAGEGKLGTDEETFVALLAHKSFQQLKLIFKEYENISGITFEQAVETELSGDLKEAILTIARRTENIARYFAEQLDVAMKGLGTKDGTLIRIIVSRAEIDLGAIKSEYQAINHKTLASAIKDETGGDYTEVLISILEGN